MGMMRRIRLGKLFLLSLILIVGSLWMGAWALSQQDDEKAIRALLLDRYLKGWNDGDADLIAKCFSEDATFSSKLRGIIKGREAIRDYVDYVIGLLGGASVAMDIQKIEMTAKDNAKVIFEIATGTRKSTKTMLLKRLQEGWLITHYE
jgi:uncharacterized protein (TIGR02246 family)